MVTNFKIKNLEYSSIFTYTPRPSSGDQQRLKEMENSRNWTIWLKQDKMVGLKGFNGQIPMSRYVAEIMRRNFDDLPFSDFFTSSTVLIPVPRSTPLPPDALWVPNRLAFEIHKIGIGASVSPCITRTVAVSKSSQSTPADRPLPQTHFDSTSALKCPKGLEEVVLVDDVITRGSTALGVANRLLEAFPDVTVRAFSAIRTISSAWQFEKWYKPIKGEISLRDAGDTLRRP